MSIPVYQNKLGRRHQIFRLLWSITWAVAARWLPRSLGCGWKRMLLRLFGANIHPTAVVYSSTRIYYPPNLTMEERACLADRVDCYNVAPIVVGAGATVSQDAVLCTASHDIAAQDHHLIMAPIHIGRHAWIAAGAFVGMGIEVGDYAVVGARAVVTKNVQANAVVAGNPAKLIKIRELINVNSGGGSA